MWIWEKKKKTRREREVRFNKAQHADRSLPGCKKTGKPSQAAGYLPFLADETARGDCIADPAELSAVFVHPTDWEGGRKDTRPPSSGTGPQPMGWVSPEVTQDGCPARLPQGHQPACPAARAEERRGAAGIWWGRERKSVKPQLPGTARLIPRSQPHTPSTHILHRSDGCLGQGQAL